MQGSTEQKIDGLEYTVSKILGQMEVMSQTDSNLVESCRILRERVEKLEEQVAILKGTAY